MLIFADIYGNDVEDRHVFLSTNISEGNMVSSDPYGMSYLKDLDTFVSTNTIEKNEESDGSGKLFI
jgi:hypothetical protein